MAAPTQQEMQDRVNALNEAIAAGERQVTIGGTTITYNTTESLMKARDDARRELHLAYPATVPTRKRQFNAYHAGRGFSCQ